MATWCLPRVLLPLGQLAYRAVQRQVERRCVAGRRRRGGPCLAELVGSLSHQARQRPPARCERPAQGGHRAQHSAAFLLEARRCPWVTEGRGAALRPCQQQLMATVSTGWSSRPLPLIESRKKVAERDSKRAPARRACASACGRAVCRSLFSSPPSPDTAIFIACLQSTPIAPACVRTNLVAPYKQKFI